MKCKGNRNHNTCTGDFGILAFINFRLVIYNAHCCGKTLRAQGKSTRIKVLRKRTKKLNQVSGPFVLVVVAVVIVTTMLVLSPQAMH